MNNIKIGIPYLNGDINNSVGSGIKNYVYNIHHQLNKDKNKQQKIEWIKIYNPLKINPTILFTLTSIFKFNNFDLIHMLEQGRPILKLNKNYRLITTVHDLCGHFDSSLKSNITNKKELLYYKLIKFSEKMALNSDFIVAVSNQTKRELISLGYNKKNIYVINNGLDAKFIKNPIENTVKNKDNFKIGYIGAINKRKNVVSLVNMFMKSNIKNATLEINGKGEELYRLKDISKFNKKIIFNGFIKQKDLYKTYKSFDVFVFPSLYEGFGFPILEAQACGVPVIIYKKAKISEEISKNCFLAEDQDHMLKIIKDLMKNGYNEKTKNNAISYSRSFTWEKNITGLLSVYDKIL